MTHLYTGGTQPSTLPAEGIFDVLAAADFFMLADLRLKAEVGLMFYGSM